MMDLKYQNMTRQTEPMEIDDGVEQYCYRCHINYYGTAMEHDSECRQHGYCMTHQRLEGPRYGSSRCDVATRIPIPGPSVSWGNGSCTCAHTILRLNLGTETGDHMLWRCIWVRKMTRLLRRKMTENFRLQRMIRTERVRLPTMVIQTVT